MRMPLPVVAHGWYAGALRTALIRYKERGERDLAEPLAEVLEYGVGPCVRARASRPALSSFLFRVLEP